MNMPREMLDDARRAWSGLWLLLRRRDEQTAARFAMDDPALTRSFFAGLLGITIAGLLVRLADPENVSGFTASFPAYLRDTLLAWAVWLISAWLLARLLGMADRFRHYAVMFNWITALLTPVADPSAALLLRLNEPLGVFFVFLVAALILVLLVRQARASLGVSTGLAILLNATAFAATVALLVLADPSMLDE